MWSTCKKLQGPETCQRTLEVNLPQQRRSLGGDPSGLRCPSPLRSEPSRASKSMCCSSLAKRTDHGARFDCLPHSALFRPSPSRCPFRTQMLHTSLAAFRPITVRLLNYRADGTPFVNDLTVMPVLDRTTNQATHFLGIMREQPLPGVSSMANGYPGVLPVLQQTAPPGDPNPGVVSLRNLMSGTLGGGYSGLQEALLGQLSADRAAAPAAAAAHAAAVRAALDQSGTPSTVHIPTQLQEALQHEVPHPQLITERQPPYKTIHVNAAWCRQCGYRSDDLIGRPYSVLLGPKPPQALVELLERAFSASRRVRTPSILLPVNTKNRAHSQDYPQPPCASHHPPKHRATQR